MTTMDDDSRVIVNLADLLAVLLAQPDADSAINGMHSVAQIISERAHSLREKLHEQGAA